MARYRIDATWYLDDDNPHVDIVLESVEPLPHEQAQHMRAVGMLGYTDEPVARHEIGRLRVDDLLAMTEKRVRAQGLDWLTANAGMTAADSFELRIATKADLDVLARLEAARGR